MFSAVFPQYSAHSGAADWDDCYKVPTVGATAILALKLVSNST